MNSLFATVQDGRLLLSQDGVSIFEGLVEGGVVTHAKVLPSGSLVLVLTEPDGEGWRPSENLLGVASDGTVLWRAELPTYGGGDCYVAVSVADDGSLTAVSWSGFRVVLDTVSGRIVRRMPTK